MSKLAVPFAEIPKAIQKSKNCAAKAVYDLVDGLAKNNPEYKEKLQTIQKLLLHQGKDYAAVAVDKITYRLCCFHLPTKHNGRLTIFAYRCSKKQQKELLGMLKTPDKSLKLKPQTIKRLLEEDAKRDDLGIEWNDTIQYRDWINKLITARDDIRPVGPIVAEWLDYIIKIATKALELVTSNEGVAAVEEETSAAAASPAAASPYAKMSLEPLFTRNASDGSIEVSSGYSSSEEGSGSGSSSESDQGQLGLGDIGQKTTRKKGSGDEGHMSDGSESEYDSEDEKDFAPGFALGDNPSQAQGERTALEETFKLQSPEFLSNPGKLSVIVQLPNLRSSAEAGPMNMAGLYTLQRLGPTQKFVESFDEKPPNPSRIVPKTVTLCKPLKIHENAVAIIKYGPALLSLTSRTEEAFILVQSITNDIVAKRQKIAYNAANQFAKIVKVVIFPYQGLINHTFLKYPTGAINLHEDMMRGHSFFNFEMGSYFQQLVRHYDESNANPKVKAFFAQESNPNLQAMDNLLNIFNQVKPNSKKETRYIVQFLILIKQSRAMRYLFSTIVRNRFHAFFKAVGDFHKKKTLLGQAAFREHSIFIKLNPQGQLEKVWFTDASNIVKANSRANETTSYHRAHNMMMQEFGLQAKSHGGFMLDKLLSNNIISKRLLRYINLQKNKSTPEYAFIVELLNSYTEFLANIYANCNGHFTIAGQAAVEKQIDCGTSMVNKAVVVSTTNMRGSTTNKMYTGDIFVPNPLKIDVRELVVFMTNNM